MDGLYLYVPIKTNFRKHNSEEKRKLKNMHDMILLGKIQNMQSKTMYCFDYTYE